MLHTRTVPAGTQIHRTAKNVQMASAPRQAKRRTPPALNCLALVTLVSALSTTAQAAQLTLEEALTSSVKSHPSIAAKQSERRAALKKLDFAERQRYPGLSAQTAQDSIGARVTTLRLEQALWTGGRITGEIDVAHATIRQAEAAVVQAEQDIMLKVVTAFTELGRVQARQIAAQSNVDEHLRLVNMIQRRVDSMVSPASDGVQANARLAQAKAELTQLDAQAVKARATLAQAIGTDVDRISLPLRRPMSEYSLETLLAAALDFAPALLRLEGELEATVADIRVRRSNALPQIKMRLDHTKGGSSPGTQVYVALDVQTGAGFSVAASVQEAEARRDAIQSQVEATRRDITEAVSADWADLKSLNQQSADLLTQVESTTAVFDSFVRQYAVGRKGWNDVLNAQREVAQARFQLADADWGALRSALRLQLVTGLVTASNVAYVPGQAAIVRTSEAKATPLAPSSPAPTAQQIAAKQIATKQDGPTQPVGMQSAAPSLN